VIFFSFTGCSGSELNIAYCKSMLVIFLQTTLLRNISPDNVIFSQQKFKQTIAEKYLKVLDF
jgi:Fe-S cluster assembly iron-binding protein IscA